MIDGRSLDCAGASFADCAFEQVQFSNPILADARFTNCRFVSCRFSHAELPGAHFEGCGFAGEDSKRCSFAFSDLQRAVFAACDLSLAIFDRTELFAIEMRECNLTGAKFTKVDFSRALSRKKIETRASFHACKMDLVDLSEAKLPGCSLAGSRLREADLSGADLTDAELTDLRPVPGHPRRRKAQRRGPHRRRGERVEPHDACRLRGLEDQRRSDVPAARRHGRIGARARSVTPVSSSNSLIGARS